MMTMKFFTNLLSFLIHLNAIKFAIVYPLSDNLEKAKILLENNPLLDGHNDLPHMIRVNFKNRFSEFDLNDLKNNPNLNGTNGVTHTDIKRLQEGRLGGQFWAVYASCSSLAKDAIRIHMEQVDTVRRIIEKHSNLFQYVSSSKEFKEAFRNKKIGSLMGMESGHAIDSSLAILRVFYQLGIRYMTLTHNCNVPWASNHLIDGYKNASSYGGLTKFGRLVIKEMNRLGMIIDLSHVSYQTMIDALDETKAPVMFSHSSVYAICNVTRNVRDDVLDLLKKNNGVIMINFFNGFINCQTGTNTTVKNVIEHLNYVKEKIGIDHIGIGSDFDGVGSVPQGLEDVSKYPNLFAELMDQNWSEPDLIKLAGGNILRVFEEVEKYSQSQIEMEPIDDFLSQDELNDDFKKCRTSF